MKLYKFRSLGSKEDFNRLKAILETGYFWCDTFSNLNDPMEGVFNSDYDAGKVEDILRNKMSYKICSFSGEIAFIKPTMWAYYANSFKGVAIEVEIDEKKYLNKTIFPVDYDNETMLSDNAQKILTKKSKAWIHENEFRFLTPSSNNFHKIGKITKVFFGSPYHIINNKESIFRENPSLKITIENYNGFKNDIKKIKGIKFIDICVQNGEIKEILSN